MKQTILLSLVLVMLLGCIGLAACGGGATSAVQNTTATIGQTTTSSPTQKPTTSTSTSGNDLQSILGKATSIASVKYDMVYSSPGKADMTATIWMKQTKMKVAYVGQDAVMIYDMAAKVVYTYMPAQKMAYKMTLDQSQIPESPKEDPNAVMKYSPQILGSETIDGKDCLVYQYSDPSQGTVKAWVWKDKGLAVRMEITTNKGKVVVQMKNFDFSTIPDSEFEIPVGVTIMSM